MKSINIISLTQAHNSLTQSEYANFIKYYGIDISDDEVSDLTVLSANIYEIIKHSQVFNSFYIGYKIQHISKEFDLLRFGDNYTVNIELKRSSTEEKIKKQLIRNRYYLSHINRVVHNLSFVVETNTLYKLNVSNEIEIIDFNELVQLLIGQQLKDVDNPDLLFNPSDYLVSPFNSTRKFLNKLYFLTGQQEKIKGSIIKKINATTQSFMTINGGPGTGKTLLTYDVVKDLKDRKNTLIVHCGQLNNGHATLISEGWNIIPIKNLRHQDVSSFDIIVVDETQRIYANQLDKLILDAQNGNVDCIFSYDVHQTLSRSENSDDIDQKISALPNIQKFQLSDKIRTNKEIASFIKLLFNNRRNDIKFTDHGNVDFDYFSNIEDVRNYLGLISDNGWEVLKWTPSQYNTEHHESYSDTQSQTAHTVIGQEFDNVAVVIDRFFSYDDSGKLTYNALTYYDSVKMLFQNITRTRKKLKLIIISNNQVLERCLSIMGQPE